MAHPASLATTRATDLASRPWPTQATARPAIQVILSTWWRHLFTDDGPRVAPEWAPCPPAGDLAPEWALRSLR